MLENGTIIANRYEIIGKIGTGGTADVYKAKCHKLNRYVAIKVLKREFSEDRNFISKFRIEAQSAAGMTHANIVNVYDVGDENGIYYIVMELVEGITLKQYIDKKGALAYKEAVSIAIQIAQGIEAAHRHNIIHRDIKPQNIIISKEGKVKVTDFGIAKVTNTDTVNSMAMGSVHYISPEQARGGFSDTTSDIYSFGITLYEMCTGRVPYDGETTVAVALMHIQNEIVPPTVYNPSIPVSLEKIILKCTQKRMDKRYQSATELIVDLKRVLITPYDDFVDMSEGVDTSPTVLFTQDELNQINARKQNNTEPDIMPVFNDGIDLTHIYEDEMEYEEHHYVAGETDDSDEEDDEKDDAVYDSNKIDKIMSWIGIATAVIVVIITIAVVARVAITFNGVGNNRQDTTTGAVTPTVPQDQGVEVPELLGHTADEAKELLNERGLGYKEIKEESEVVAKGYVIGQSVESGAFVAKNSQIIVTVSAGAKTFSMIDVTDKTEDEAREALEDVKLKVTIEYEFDRSIALGSVIRTSPVAGAQVRAGDNVTVVVSRGRENAEIEVPSLINDDESTARLKLDNLGLVAQLGGTVASSTVEAGKVVAQNYAAGTRVSAGTVIEYVLSSGAGNKKYTGQVTYVKDWYLAKPDPEGYDEATGTREAYAVLRQNKDNRDYTNEILPYTDINSLGDSYRITFDGIVDGVSLGNVDFYIRFTWTDPATGEARTQTQDVMSLSVTLSEVANQ